MAVKWQPNTLAEMTKKIYAAGQAITGTGFLELWEWEAIAPSLLVGPSSETIEDQKAFLAKALQMVEWGTSMSRTIYNDLVEKYRPFEPKVYGFIDDRVRASPLLDLGNTVSLLGEIIATKEEAGNYLLGSKNASHARGLNPGIALGELVIIDSSTPNRKMDKDKIYVFTRPPADLKPIAGIATVTEGNLVSHVQLLARNLSIPNTIISDQNFDNLRDYNGQQVFYAVTSKGKVILKLADKMSKTEKELFAKKENNKTKISVPIDKINLTQNKVVDLRDIKAKNSGVLCGPKAANLGQLKEMYPDHVVEGLVIPFGIFRQHMDLPMAGQSGSYWDFLTASFAEAKKKKEDGKNDVEVDSFLLEKLSTLRKGIQEITLKEDFVQDLKKQFKKILGKKIGQVPVFVRSDTNMEDLKNFTGAGLNLTLFNVVEEDEIINGIKKVWASPYTERSFKWRQRLLLNPENIFPSILIIPSVDVDFSGVLVTKGITNNKANDLTLAINRGAGGAVSGQATESYLLRSDGTNELLSPTRELTYRRLPGSGGTSKNIASFEKPIISKKDLDYIRSFARTVEDTYPNTAEGESIDAYDIEFGFSKDKLSLFQIRPFVDNDNTWENELIIGTSDNSKSLDTNSSNGFNWRWITGLLLAVLGITVYLKSRSNQ